MGVFSCLKGDPEDQTDVKVSKPSLFQKMWSGIKAKFNSKKIRREQKLLEAFIFEVELQAERRKYEKELAKQKFKKEMEKSEIRALEMVRTLWGLDESVTIDEIRRNQEKNEKELREQREREKSEAEAFEMVRILWGLDESVTMDDVIRHQKEKDEVEALELIVEDIRHLFDQDKSDEFVLQFTNKQKELAEIINSKEQKVLIAEFDMMLEDLRFLFNEDVVCGEITMKHKETDEREIEALELIVEDIRRLFDQEKDAVLDFANRQKELLELENSLFDLMGDRFVDEDKEIEILEKKFDDFMAAFHATQSEDAYRRYQREASILEQRLENVLDLLMDEEAGYTMTAEEAAECEEVLVKCYLSKNDLIRDFQMIDRIIM